MTADSDVTVEEINEAAARIEGHVYRSPCPHSAPLSEATGSEVYCKLEQLQRTGSFKERGACNTLLSLSPEARKRGVVAASAGNHALGLAYHGARLKIPVTVAMPKSAPLMKVANCRKLGATVVHHGEDFEQAWERANAIATETGAAYVNGYDDAPIIAGQGTLGLEILEQVPDVDAILVPVGGAGLIAGISLAVKQLKPEVAVIGVEPKRAASFSAALEAGRTIPVEIESTLADGLAVPRVGERAFRIAKTGVDRMVLVGERDIARAILSLIELEKSVVEGAGAIGLGALLAGGVPELRDKKVVLPLCGGNIDTTVLGRIIERGLVAEGRLHRFDVFISDRPGGLARLTRILAEEEASVIDIAHDRAFSGEAIDRVVVHCVVETHDSDHFSRLNARVEEERLSLRVREYRI